MTKKIAYVDSGVSIDEGNLFVNKIKDIVSSTFDKNVPEGIGGFAGFYSIKDFMKMKSPMLVASTDGVGTKLKIAIDAQKFDTVGIDLVAMCVNDLIVTGAKPLFFLDYIATGKLNTDKSVEILQGIGEGCRQAGAALLGGETAEMPGMYKKGDFDLAGFSVGIVDKNKVINGKKIKEGDILIGLGSSGFHSNGYSLLRKLFFEEMKMKGDEKLFGKSLFETLLEPTKIYVNTIMSLLKKDVKIKGMVHITGGGFYDNIPRVMPEGLTAKIYKENFPNLDCYKYVEKSNLVEEKELYRVFNMGVGFVVVVSKNKVQEVMDELKNIKEEAFIIGEVIQGSSVIIRGVDF